ncbi:MAG TPA: archaetidylserine decarboxylase [Steroidobacteraceae bacterium]|jgi:phosphatidylserine decarboxylase|nr:archaetidylserine decarboxylase [Steroidobacteraceae bacterium]
MMARLFIWLQYILPQHALSRLVRYATRVRAPWFKNRLVRGFMRLYSIDMTEAAQLDPFSYGSFNEFFTRALKADARRIADRPDEIACPVDGTISEAGRIDGDRLLQAKGRHYTLGELLASPLRASRFEGGAFATIYLAPFDYHRVHMPVSGHLRETVHVPGRLFSVNAITAARVPRLFARNERVLTFFDTAFGEAAFILVGALNVGSMATVWAGDITPAPQRAVTTLPPRDVTLQKGEELGRFNMGSTVILLFQAGRVSWHEEVRAGATVQLGQALGTLK